MASSAEGMKETKMRLRIELKVIICVGKIIEKGSVDNGLF
jgi:hypothetical protein